MNRQRLEPTTRQLAEAGRLLHAIPTETRLMWSSPQAEKFIDYVANLQDDGVPCSWLAEHLGLSATTLNIRINRRREGAA